MTQGRRTQVMRDFAKAKTQILVTTDIAARGIDIEGITHVFNYDVPHDVDYYIHRIGRTGRAGNDGLAIMYATAADTEWVRRIERNIKATITKYTANGKIKVHAQNAAPKRVRTHDDARPASTYQATKKKAHKAKHQGSNNLKRRNK
jgi:ATP-dependent RNA helicase DeaD